MNPFLRVIPLVQHTPMIHFQAEQVGATLRATELKPKIDKFVWEHLRQMAPALYAKYADLIKPEFFNSPSTRDIKAGAYKVRISGTPTAYFIPTAYIKGQQKQGVADQLKALYEPWPKKMGLDVIGGSPYFANVDKIEKQKWDEVRMAVMYENVQLEIMCPHTRLLELITEMMPYVLATYNFGTRGTKGFGHFGVKGHETKVLAAQTRYYFDLKTSGVPVHLGYERLFERIHLVYNSLRAGLNLPQGGGFYCKSLLFKYFAAKGIRWEKREIKQRFFADKLRSQTNQHPLIGKAVESPLHYNSENKKLVRDLLGLSSNQSWGQAYDKDTVTKQNLDLDASGHQKIDRFASPIWIKPVATQNGFRVYIGAHAVPAAMKGAQFSIERKGDAFPLSTPDSFDPQDFLAFAFSIDLEDHISPDFHGAREYKDLFSTFEMIQANL